MINTRITEMLGIKYPVFQGAMAWVSTPELVSAVSNAGGLGILGGTIFDGTNMRKNIRLIKDLTDKPFGVNFLARSPVIDDLLEVIADEGVDVVTYGVGNPEKIIAALKPTGTRCIPVIPQVRLAVRAEKDGADAIIIEGIEAGGHVGLLTTMALVPQTMDKVNVPVIAAGGIADARGLVAALALGADGIQMGTRFICVEESPAHINSKMKVINSEAEDTVITGKITGMPVRVIKNRLTEEFLRMESEGKSPMELALFGSGKMYKAFVEGDAEIGSVMGGQICGMIKDIVPVKKLIEDMIQEAEEIINRLKLKFTGSK